MKAKQTLRWGWDWEGFPQPNYLYFYIETFLFLLYFLIKYFKKTSSLGDFGGRRDLLWWEMAAGNGMISRLDV